MSATRAASGVVIRGTTDAAEVAAVLALLAARRPREDAESAYDAWRRGRLNALRRRASRDGDGL